MNVAEGRIRLLDPHTINQIAAGEVVERPASAVKELAENALDAGASRIEIDLKRAGQNLIRVADDGGGMTADEARLALLRHATSKITRVEDLNQVATMGFRGEAIPSIASVSRLTISTGTEEGVRTRIVVEEGKIAHEEAVSGPRGTEVIVEDLFGSTPARLKFLKTDATELNACVECVSKLALSRPDVRFVLRHDKNELIRTSGSGDLLTALGEIWGREAARALVPVDLFSGAARVHGYVSPPHFTKPTRTQQWFFVNGRIVRSKTLMAAIDQAVRGFTPERRHPLCLLMIEVDPSRLDVNVSPTKSEVRFHAEGAIFDSVRRAVKEALLNSGMAPTADGLAAADEAMRSLGGGPAIPPWNPQPLPAQESFSLGSSVAESGEESATHRLPDLLDDLKILGQVDATFILAENRSAVLIIDQHVAHERVLYEMLRDVRGSGAVETQKMLTPETIQADRRTLEAVTPRLDELRELGFDLEPFGSDSLLVRAVPALIRGRTPIAILKDMLDEMSGGVMNGCLTAARDEVYIMCSCKMAVKAGDKLGFAEMERLVQDLAKTENPYFCPHGRPITIVMPKSDLRRRFKR